MTYPTHTCRACCRRNGCLHISPPPPCPISARHSLNTDAEKYNKN